MSSTILGFLPPSILPIIEKVIDTVHTSSGLSESVISNFILFCLVLLSFYFSLTIITLLFGSTKGKKQRGQSLLLLGHCNSGKTCMFYKLKANTFPETVSSLEPNEQAFEVTEAGSDMMVTYML